MTRNFRGLANVKRLMEQGVIPDTSVEEGENGELEIPVRKENLTLNCAVCARPISGDDGFVCPDCKVKVDAERARREAEENEKIAKL